MKKIIKIFLFSFLLFYVSCTNGSSGGNTTIVGTSPVGAIKIVNSWGEGGSWENVPDGHYWIPYDVIKNNQMVAFLYVDDLTAVYEPHLILTFQITHGSRNDLVIKAGVENTNIEKFFTSSDYYYDHFGEATPGLTDIEGSEPFPGNVMVLDITEFGTAIYSNDVYLEIENLGTDTGTLESFGFEQYSDYSLPPADDTIVLTGTAAINSESTDQWTLDTSGLGNQISLAFSAVNPNGKFQFEYLQSLPRLAGDEPAQEGASTYRTGFVRPSSEDFERHPQLTGIDQISNVRSVLPLAVDLSSSKYFPPVGDQGTEGTCAPFSVAYYIQTYTEARKHNRDLSAITWDNSATSTSDGGAPSSSLEWFFSPDFLYHQINGGVDNGSRTFDAIDTVIRQGGASWATMPYDTSDSISWPSELAWRESANFRGKKTFNGVPSGYFYIVDDSGIELLKQLLDLGYLVSTAIYTPEVFGTGASGYSDGKLSSKDVLSSSSLWINFIEDHAQTIVGYKEGGAWNPNAPDS